MTNATQPTQEELDAAARDQEIKIQAIIKTLTVQRDSANNAVVNALADKAVVDAKLNLETELRHRYQHAHASESRSATELRILVVNLQKQLEETQEQNKTLNETVVGQAERIENLSTKAEPVEAAQIDEEQTEVPSVLEEVPPLPAIETGPEECPDCSDCGKDCSNKLVFLSTSSAPSSSKKN